jgi:hypothetical protein
MPQMARAGCRALEDVPTCCASKLNLIDAHDRELTQLAQERSGRRGHGEVLFDPMAYRFKHIDLTCWMVSEGVPRADDWRTDGMSRCSWIR